MSTQTATTTLGGLQSAKATDLYAYAKNTLDPIIQPMIAKLMLEQPTDPIHAMIEHLQSIYSTSQLYSNKSYDGIDEKQSDELPTLPINDDTIQLPKSRARRAGISAEPVNTTSDHIAHTTLRVIHKSADDILNIKNAIKNNILFNHIDNDSMNIVINAMERKIYQPNDTIIRQGDCGDEFYVLSEGICDCYVNQNKVKQYIAGESFGELALMYNCVRQASIIAQSGVSVWAMDRHTFHTVLMKTTVTKRLQYESFLQNVPILQTLDKYECSKIADVLQSRTYNTNDVIIEQGDINDRRFFILESGECKAYKLLNNSDKPSDVYTYNKQGDYFGELSLINDQPRQASVICTCDNTTVVSLDRDSFIRLLGPAETLLKRNTEVYQTIEKQIAASQQNTVNEDAPVQT